MSQTSESTNRSRGRGHGGNRGGGPRGGSPGGPRGGSPGGPRGGPGQGAGGGRGTPPPNRGGGGGGQRGFGGPRGGRGGGPATGEIFNAGGSVALSDRLSPRHLDALVASFNRAPQTAEMPLRPGWGTKGKPGIMRANFFAITLRKDLIIYEYEIKFSETLPPGRKDKRKEKMSGAVQAQVLVLLERTNTFRPYIAYIAHDRRTRLVSSRPLPEDLSFDILYMDELASAPRQDASTFTVTFEFKNELSSNELTQAMEGNVAYRESTVENPTSTGDKLSLISALNLVLQQHASRTGIRVGKNRYFFPSSNVQSPLSLGLFARQGFFLSVRPTFKQLMVNINVCMTAFYEPGNLADAMFEFQRRSRGGMPNSFVERLQVVTNHLGYAKRSTARKIVQSTARKQMIQVDGQRISVEQYFKKQYKITLRYADDLPLIDATPPGAKNTTYLPAELCSIPPNQAFHGLLDKDSTAAMIKVAANPPAYNANAIVNQGLPQLGLQHNALAGPVPGFGLSVSNDMAVIPFRVLDSPSIVYKVGRPNVRDAGWNILNVKFQNGGNMQRWAVLLVTEGKQNEFAGGADPELREFIQTFQKKCADSGMITSNTRPQLIVTEMLAPWHRQQDPYRERAVNQIRQTLKEKLNPREKPSFILVLLSGIDDYIYPGIKRLCDTELGLQTVHMLLTKARVDPRRPEKQDQYFSNVALKVNVKLGGINHTLDSQSMAWLREKKTMMVGMDVTHPSPRSRKGTPSVVAVVASIDDHFVQYPASLGIQRNANINREAEEMIQDLDNMMLEKLQLYQKHNKRLPDRIIVFRDGVSEGQFRLVLRHELPKYLAAFKKLQGGTYNPKLTIIVCGKRHHVKGFGTNQDFVTKNGNNLPGSVVDKGITDVFNHDFYLQAHHGLQGSARSTHYTVVYDENQMSADTIQALTNQNSYLYARATKAVSLIPPAYYADLACDRARLYLNNFLNLADSDDKSTVGSATGGRKRTKEEEQAEREKVFQDASRMWGNGLHATLRESMFYI